MTIVVKKTIIYLSQVFPMYMALFKQKGKKTMKQKIITLAIAILCMFLLAGCQCEHEWMPASCISPKICSLCEETEGEALAHDWIEANCEHPKTCSRCNITEGNTMEHTLGEWTETVAYRHGKTVRKQSCSICGTVVNTEIVPIETFVSNGIFTLTPREFMERFIHIASDTMEGPSYSMLRDREILQVGLSLGDSRYGLFTFFDSDGNVLSNSDFDSTGIGAFEFSYVFKMGPLTWAPEMEEFQDYDVMILGDQFAEALFRTCEPGAGKEATYYFQSVGFTAGTGTEDWVETGTYTLEYNDKTKYYISQEDSYNENYIIKIIGECL